MARGGQAALIELCEQLAWLGAALRTSPVSFGISLATPSITTSKDTCSKSGVPSITVQLGFVIAPLLGHGLRTDVDGTCWHAIFHNPMVVSGFPILARYNDEQGLELPLDVMSTIVETHLATHYDTILVLKDSVPCLFPHVRLNVPSPGISYSTKMGDACLTIPFENAVRVGSAPTR